jgi:peptide/nickel transport system substrate-binding protein
MIQGGAMRIGIGRSIIFLSLWAVILLSQGLIADAQTRGGTLNVIVNPEPAILVLGLSQQGPTQMIGGKIYEGLLTYDFNLNPLPSLAKSWTVSPDKKTYTFKLQENVRWHDGKPFTAQDVIFTTRDFLPKVHSRARQNFSHVAEWEAPDPHTMVFRMKTPFAPFLGAFQVASAPYIRGHRF